MIGRWRTVALLSMLMVCCTPCLLAQRAAQALNYNVHEGKHDTGGFGLGFLLGSMINGNMYRANVVSDTGGGGRLGDDGSKPVDRVESVFGVNIAYQMGSDSDIVGADLSLDIVTHSVEMTEAGGFGTISSATTIAKLGVDFIINFYKSEYVERDGRRSRENFNVSMLIGPNISSMFGDFADLNGLTAIGLDFGLAMDIPLNEDSLQFAPSMWLEINYHMTDQIDSGTHDSTDTGLTAIPQQARALDGLLVRSHNFLPSYAMNLGGDFILTPTFVGERGDLITSWRFSAGMYLTVPLGFNSFAADLPGDPLYSDLSRPTYLTFVFGASYFW